MTKIQRLSHDILTNRPALLLSVWSLWLGLQHFALGPWSYVRIHFEAQLQLGYWLGFSSDFSQWLGPAWNRFAAGGVDALASGLDAGAEVIPFSIFPGWLAYGGFLTLMMFIGAYFMYRLARDDLDVGHSSAMLAAFLYPMTFLTFGLGLPKGAPYGDYVILRHSLEILPFIVWALPRLDIRRSFSWIAALGLGMLFSELSLYPIAPFYIPVICWWLLFVTPRRGRNASFLLVLFVLGWALFDFRSIWAGLMHGPISQRADFAIHDAPFDSLQVFWLRWLVFLVPAAIALIGRGGRERTIWAILVILFLAVAFKPAYQLLVLYFPESLRGVRHITPRSDLPNVHFLLTTVFVVGLSRLVDVGAAQKMGRYLLPLGRTIIVGGFIVVFALSALAKKNMLWDTIHGSTYATLFEHPDLRELARVTKDREPFRTAVVSTFRVGPQLEPAFLWKYGLETAGGYFQLYSLRYKRFWRQVIDPVLSRNVSMRNEYAVRAQQIYLAQPPGLAWEMCRGRPFQTCQIEFSEFYNLHLLSLANVKYVVSPFPLVHDELDLMPSKFRNQFLALEATPSIRDSWEVNVRGGYGLATPLYIYRNRSSLPRFFIAGALQLFKDKTSLLDALQRTPLKSLRSHGLVLESDLMEIESPELDGTPGEVEVKSYGSDRIELEATARGRSVLIVTNNYNPYWRACVDGKSAKIFPVDHAFQGLVLSPGRHVVTLRYHPPYKLGSIPSCT